jgi:hypothetical protein
MRLVGFISARIARGFALQPTIVRRMPMIRTIKFFALHMIVCGCHHVLTFEPVCAQGEARS